MSEEPYALDEGEAASETAAENAEWEKEGKEKEWELAIVEKGKKETESIPPITYQQERGGVAWCELYGKAKDDAGGMHLVKINLTNRGTDGTDALRGLLAALAVAKNEFHMLPYMPTLPANPPTAAPQNAPQPISAPGIPATPPPPPAVAPVPSQAVQPAQAQGGTFQIVKVEVAPRADGKSEVKLYSQGHKFPDLKMVGEPARIAAQFGVGWQKEHFQVVTAYNVSLKVDWQPSTRLTSNGTPYKDVTAINPG